MKKKSFALLASTALTVSLVGSTAFAKDMNMSLMSSGDSMQSMGSSTIQHDGPIHLNFNGVYVDQQQNAMVHMMNDRVYASVDSFTKVYGSTYSWDQSTSALVIDGQAVTDQYGKIRMHNGVLMAPIRALAEAIGGKSGLIGWDSATQTAIVSIINGDHGKQWAVAKLSEKVSNINGTASLVLDTQSQDLTVVIDASGFEPNSNHPEHIHSLSDGKIIYPLEDLLVDDNGHGTSITTIHNVSTIPSSAWFVNLHQGPDMSSAAGRVAISKGDVVNVSQAKGTLAPQNGNKVDGTAELSLNPTTNELSVVVHATGITPNTVHPEHIHALSDKSVVFPLNDLKADANGNGTSVTVIPNVTSIPSNTWFINIHQGSTMSTDAGKAPIANGNVE